MTIWLRVFRKLELSAKPHEHCLAIVHAREDFPGQLVDEVRAAQFPLLTAWL